MPDSSPLNDAAVRLVNESLERADELGIRFTDVPGGGRIIDAGVDAPGGIAAGVLLARLCLADLVRIDARAGDAGDLPGVGEVEVHVDDPIGACLASQYAGWRISVGKYFAMGSGPMRAAYGKEELFDTIGRRESARAVVGVLEADELPPPEVLALVAEKTGVERNGVTLAVAPTRSEAGCVQIVARSVETALHKLHELHFDLGRVVAGSGTAPIPPVAKKSLEALGRTNDAVLYGARVELTVRGDDASLEEIGPRVPSSASPDHGTPFAEIFRRYEFDFYKVDPMLFSPAVVTFHNTDTGSRWTFGRTEAAVLERSFGS